MNLRLRKKVGRYFQLDGPSKHAAHLIDPRTGLYVEEHFQERLNFEKRRVDRSGAKILIGHVNLEGVEVGQHRTEVMGSIASALIANTRETDIKGWVRTGPTIGIIFGELPDENRAALHERLSTAFQRYLNSETIDKINIRYYVYPSALLDHLGNGAASWTKAEDDASARQVPGNPQEIMKKAVDVIGSACGLLLLGPVLVAISLAIKLTSPGPVIFRQERVGLNGERFVFLKFRTMHQNNDSRIHERYIDNLIRQGMEEKAKGNGEDSEKVFKITNDKRVTRLGSFLRGTSLDELPQLINVLRGEMSLVGPRPAIPYEVEKYAPWHRRRMLEVKPGITGLWQVKGRSRTTFNEMVRLDLAYIRNRSLWLDVKILLLTPWAVITGEGAY